MSAVARALYQALRGAGAVIEGAEFLLTHRHLLGRHLPHVLTAAACTLGAMWLAAKLTAYLPPAPGMTLPWYLVLIEWCWSRLPAALAAEFAAWAALTAYLGLAWPRRFVWEVMAQRHVAPPAQLGDGRGRAFFWLSVCGVGGAGIAWVPIVGLAAAVVLAWPVLGAGLAMAILDLRGWRSDGVYAFLTSHWATLVGLGLGVVVSLAIPAVNLVALPCAVAGATCLLVREPQPAAIKTTAGTTPYASPDR